MIQTDALVIGAGPVGLFQAFQLGLLGLKVEVVDVLPQAGGQCIALYPDKPIYDVPGVPRCTGRELTGLLLQQASPFLPIDADTGRRQHLHLGHLIESIEAAPHGGWLVGGSGGWRCQARALVISAGAGAFVPRGLGVAALEGAHNVSHHLPDADDTDAPDHAAGHPSAQARHPAAPPWAGQHLVVAGGGEEALSAVLAIAHAPHPEHRPARLSLLHRRDAFQAEPQQEAAVRELIAQGRVQLVIGLPQAAHREGDRIRSLELLGADGQAHTLVLDHLLVRLGLSPKLGPLTQWGLDLERKQVRVDTATFASSQAGVHAVGDINTYPGKKRLLLCGFHEATLAAHAIATALQPDAPPHLLYTTTSPVLHQRLGV